MTKVLIVDDSMMDRHLAGKCAEEEEMEVAYAENGEDALSAIPEEKPDIIVTDLQMPEMDGLELVREVNREFPHIPVILMTAYGSEEIAVTALKCGAASYVPKRNVPRDLGQTLRVVIDVAHARREQDAVFEYLQQNDLLFELGYQRNAGSALIGFIQGALRNMKICTEGEMIRIGTALTEAIANAIDHGNLELDSNLREQDDHAYRDEADNRMKTDPYKDRVVTIEATLVPDEARFVIRDQGPGFDFTSLPDPLDPENLMRVSGRGLLLIQTFMDEVTFNDTGNEITMIKRRSEPVV